MLSVLLISGCTDINIKCSVSSDNTANMEYSIAIDTSNIESNDYEMLISDLNDIVGHWDSYDDVTANIIESDAENKVYMSMHMEEQCSDREEAFNTLYSFMSSELSVFDKVRYAYNKNYYGEDYEINGIVDFSKIINSDELSEAYPNYVQSDLQKVLDNTTLTMTFTLPENISQDSNEIIYKTTEQQLSLNNPSEFNINGTINNTENIKFEHLILNTKDDYTQKIYLLISLFLLLLILSITFIIIIKKMRKSKY